MAKKMNVLMVLQDKFTKPLGNTTKEIQKSNREIKRSKHMIAGWVDKANSKIKSMAATTIKATATMTAAIGGLAIGAGFKEAFDMETYKAQLETATGDTQKAAEIMKYAINMANKTPFEGGQLVEAASKFEAMGMSAEEWLGRAGDMAGATGKDIIQATEALIDANAGEWERMKEFGIKGVKDMSELVNIMDSRFSGGMEKLAQTTKGTWSTVTGVVKNSLAKVVGIMDDGSVRSGSALDLLRTKLTALADKLVEWQNDGTIDRIAEKVTNGLTKALDVLGNAIAWVKNNANWLVPALGALVTAFTALNVITTIGNAMAAYKVIVTGVTAAQGALNFAMSSNPMGMVVIAISALVAAGIALWQNWDVVKEKAQALCDKVKEVGEGIKEALLAPFESIKTAIEPIIDWLGGKFDWIKEKVSNMPVIGGVVEKIKNRKKTTPGNATGTPYFRGGLTRINEGGRGELITLPTGSRIYPAGQTEKIIKSEHGKKTIIQNLNIHVTGGADPHETGRIVADEIIKALDAV